MSSTIQEALEARIDFTGQQLAEQISKVILVLATALSFLIGFALQSLTATFSIFAGSVVLVAMLVLPPWPMLNRKPVKWAVQSNSKKTK